MWCFSFQLFPFQLFSKHLSSFHSKARTEHNSGFMYYLPHLLNSFSYFHHFLFFCYLISELYFWLLTYDRIPLVSFVLIFQELAPTPGWLLNLPTVLIRLLLLWWNIMIKSTWWGKGLLGLSFYNLCSLLKEVSTRNQTVEKPISQNWHKGHRGVLPSAWLIMACLALLELRTTCIGMTPLTMGWALPYQWLIEKMVYRLVYS